MSNKISELTVDEFKELVAKAVHDSIEDVLEDLAALASPDYLASVREAREQYKRGEFVSLDDLDRA